LSFRCVQNVDSGEVTISGEQSSNLFASWAQVGQWGLKIYFVPSRRSRLHERYLHSATLSQTWCSGCVHMKDGRKFCRISWRNSY